MEEEQFVDIEDGERSLLPEKYERIKVETSAGNGHAWYYLENSAIHVDSDDEEPAMLCVPQGKRICYFVINALVQKAHEIKADSIVFHGPNDALDRILTRYSQLSGLELEKTPDYLEKGFSDITLRLQ